MGMDAAQLRRMDQAELDKYLWGRLRLESMNPPVSSRFGQEPPEQFIFEAVKQADDLQFKSRVIKAIRANLAQMARLAAPSHEQFWNDRTNDQQLASLAFLSNALEAVELTESLYAMACSWLIEPGRWSPTSPDERFHVLHSLAQLQQGPRFAGLWEDLWEHGPRTIRGLTMFGWARADAVKALEHLGELVEMKDEIDLPATSWSLIQDRGPGLRRVIEASARLSAKRRKILRSALATAGADDRTLQTFDVGIAILKQRGLPTLLGGALLQAGMLGVVFLILLAILRLPGQTVIPGSVFAIALVAFFYNQRWSPSIRE